LRFFVVDVDVVDAATNLQPLGPVLEVTEMIVSAGKLKILTCKLHV